MCGGILRWYVGIELTSRSPAFRVHPAAWNELHDVLLRNKMHISTDNILLWVVGWADAEWGRVAFVSIDPTHKLHARKRPRTGGVWGGEQRFCVLVLMHFSECDVCALLIGCSVGPLLDGNTQKASKRWHQQESLRKVVDKKRRQNNEFVCDFWCVQSDIPDSEK